MYIYMIGDRMAIDASKVSFNFLAVLSRTGTVFNFSKDKVLLVESNDPHSICKDDLVIRHEFKRVHGWISDEGFFETLVNLCQYEEFNQYTDIEEDEEMFLATIGFKGIAQKFKVHLNNDFKNSDFQKQNYQAQDIEKYFGDWELV